jgi:hypothetical protein
MFISRDMMAIRLIYDLGDIPVVKILELVFSLFFGDFDRSRENLAKKFGIRLILMENLATLQVRLPG